VTKALKAVKDAVEAVVIRSCYSGAAFQYSHGLSVYFPWAKVDYVEEYEKLEFPNDTNWHTFLKDFLDVTQRDPRPGVPPEQTCAPIDMGMLIIRKSPPGTKGGAFCAKAGGTKNHPDKYFRSTECMNNQAILGNSDPSAETPSDS
jgi:hypothetical protein